MTEAPATASSRMTVLRVRAGTVARWVPALLCMLGAAAFAQQEPAAPAEPSVPYIDAILERSQVAYGTGMKALVDDVMKVANVTDDAKKAALLKAADAAVQEKMDLSKKGLWKAWHALEHDGDADQMLVWAAYRKTPEAMLTPDRSPLWEKGLKEALSEQEFAKWDAEASRRRGRIEKVIVDYLNRGRDAWKSQRIEARKAQVGELVTQINLEPAAAAAVTAGIEVAVTQALPKWGGGLEKSIREYVKTAFLGDSENRLQTLEAGQLNFGASAEPEAMEAEDATWKALLKQTLPAPAFAAWEQRETQRLDRRMKALVSLAVAEADRKVKLTEEQRSKLEALLAGVVRQAKPKLDALLSQSYVNTESVLMVLNGVPEAEVKSLLDADQQRGWREVAVRYNGWWNQN